MASLSTIPLELLVLISSYLPTPDLGSLRRSCKGIEKSLYEWFSQEFFSKKQFMLSQPSLQALIDISNHPTLSKQVKHVIIGTEQFQDPSGMHFESYEVGTRYAQGYADQFTLFSNGIDREMLTEAFANFPNLDTVGIRDFNATGRVRDDARWTSYGATTVFKETGIRLQAASGVYGHFDTQGRIVSRIFASLIYALGKAGRTPPAFEILLRQRMSGLHDNAFNIPDVALPAVLPVLENMKSLLLTLNVPVSPSFSYQGALMDQHLCTMPLLRTFLAHTPNLTHLRLNFQKEQHKENDNFLRWLGSPVSSSSVSTMSSALPGPNPVALAHLERIDLGTLKISPHVLLNIITKYAPTLKGLSLWRITITPFDYKQPYQQIDGSQRNVWSQFFEKLGRIPSLELDYLLAGMLIEKHGHNDLQVTFKVPLMGVSSKDVGHDDADGQDNVLRKPTMEYSGKEMNKFLQGVVDQVHVDWPQPPAHVFEPSDQGSDYDDDEEMIDEDGEDDEE